MIRLPQIIRVWDPRSGKKLKKMIGHTDNVKAILLNSSGELVFALLLFFFSFFFSFLAFIDDLPIMQCLSGSSDGTVKLWDLGQQRCVRTYTFDDAVWALQANASFSEFTAGCRDGSVFKVDMATSQAQLLFEEPNPIFKLLHLEDDTIWAATSSATIHKWEAKAKFKDPVPEDESGPSTSQTSSAVLLESQKATFDTPLQAIEGTPGVIKYHITNNRRHILTLDSDHCVQLFDVLTVEPSSHPFSFLVDLLINDYFGKNILGQEAQGLFQAGL